MKEIRLQKVDPEVFRVVLKYLYTKDLDVVDPNSSTEFLIDTLTLAHEYSVEPLKCKLEYLISLNITWENVYSFLEFAEMYQLTTVNLSHIFHL